MVKTLSFYPLSRRDIGSIVAGLLTMPSLQITWQYSMIKPMKLRKLITSLLLIASVVFLYFGPYNNKNLFEQLKFLESKTKVVQVLKDEYWVLSSIKNDKCESNETLYQAVSDYIKEERDI